ncbi:MAG: hypothetical protein IT348_19420 [Candidatus Eisenbacteria bacterium]|nr:hypothetical protein [Candidatus Eisenbacteria bacterium]
MLNPDRWRVSLHEASHIVAAAVFGAKPSYVALLPGGRGLAAYDPIQDPFEAAIVSAAGEAGESLAEFHSPGTHDSELQTTSTRAPKQLSETERAVVESSFAELGEHDFVAIRRFAIRDDDYEAWADRVRLVRHHAHVVTRRYAGDVLRVASRLYSESIVVGSELRELLGLETPSAVGASRVAIAAST